MSFHSALWLLVDKTFYIQGTVSAVPKQSRGPSSGKNSISPRMGKWHVSEQIQTEEWKVAEYSHNIKYGSTSHMQLLSFKLKIYFLSHATFQRRNSHMWLLTMMLNSDDYTVLLWLQKILLDNTGTDHSSEKVKNWTHGRK